MSKIEPKILKGFRDFLPMEARKRSYVINILKKVFESYGFDPLETPALEYEEILKGKMGDEAESLLYLFKDKGDREIGLRYDQTVPLARVVAQYPNEITMPFKRYQIQPVWRAENTQRGRFREFMQCDADIVGNITPLADAEIIVLAAKSVEELGFKNYKILINDRSNSQNYFKTKFNIPDEKIAGVFRIIDKLKKVGNEGVVGELVEKEGLTNIQANEMLNGIKTFEMNENLKEIFSYLEKLGINNDKYVYDQTLSRGLDYYTGMVFEIEIEEYSAGSVCGGGRYDNLIGMFAGKQIPAIGFAFGFDRLIEAMDELGLFPEEIKSSNAKVLVTVFDNEFLERSIEVSSRLRSNNINTEIWLDADAKLDKQIKYADKKGIQYVVIIGPDEAKNNTVTVKNLKNGEQKVVEKEKIIDLL